MTFSEWARYEGKKQRLWCDLVLAMIKARQVWAQEKRRFKDPVVVAQQEFAVDEVRTVSVQVMSAATLGGTVQDLRKLCRKSGQIPYVSLLYEDGQLMGDPLCMPLDRTGDLLRRFDHIRPPIEPYPQALMTITSHGEGHIPVIIYPQPPEKLAKLEAKVLSMRSRAER
jgi:hypothetical protein